MRRNLPALLVGILLFTVMGGTAMSETASVSRGNTEVIPGEYLVLFKARESVLSLEGRDRTVAVAMMLEMQAEYLSVKFGLTVENTFSAISESSGKGMFFVRSDKGAADAGFEQALLSELRSDHFIEAVSPNEVKKMISTPSAGIAAP